MHELRLELEALKAWDDSCFDCHDQVELDAIGHRIIRMAELMRKIREIARRN